MYLVLQQYALDNILKDTYVSDVLSLVSSLPSYLGLQLQLLVQKCPLLEDLHLEALLVPV